MYFVVGCICKPYIYPFFVCYGVFWIINLIFKNISYNANCLILWTFGSVIVLVYLFFVKCTFSAVAVGMQYIFFNFAFLDNNKEIVRQTEYTADKAIVNKMLAHYMLYYFMCAILSFEIALVANIAIILMR
jgi:hypothetical protein